MGEVYVAYDETLGRRVALKSILASRRPHPMAKARFLREARVLSRLDHPNICRIHDLVALPPGDFLVLELVEGEGLDAAIEEGLAPERRLPIARQIAAALAAAHAEGVVHRDLKPSNVMITAAGDVKVLDFGLAWVTGPRPAPGISSPATVSADLPATEAESASQRESGAPPPAAEAAAAPELLPDAPAGAATPESTDPVHTALGVITGTPAYMSPEQARGEAATTASDLYAFGVLLQEMVTGKPPYPRTLGVAETLDRVRRAESAPPTGAPKDLAALIARLKSLSPAQRPTAVDAAARLAWIEQRPRRLLRRSAAAALAAVAVLGVAKYTVDLSRERTLAVAARQEADRRRQQAEDLIGFMLGDLRTRLEPVGQLAILDQVGAKAMDYFAAVPEAALSDEELLRRSAALYQIGEVRIAQGNLAGAEAPLRESLALAQALVTRRPNDGERVFGLAQSHYWVGYVAWQRHDLATAARKFEEYLAAAQRLVAIDPARADWRREVAYANSNLGSVLEAKGDLAAALARFEACLTIERALLAKTPDDRELQRSAASSHNTIAVVLRSSGRLLDALRELDEELAMRTALVAAEPKNFTYRLRLSVARTHRGYVLAALGRASEAAAEAEQADTLLEEIAAHDPSNRAWQRELAVGRANLGTARLVAGRTGEAVQHLRRAVAVMQAIAAADATNVGWQRDLADQRRALAQALLASGDLAGAAREAAAAVDLASRLTARPESDAQDARAASSAHAALAAVAAAERDPARAGEEWQRAAEALAASRDRTSDYRLLDPLAVALLRLGRTAEAAPILAKLAAMGYRDPQFIRNTQGPG